MHTWIGLFRGINVGGNNLLPMAKLKVGLESLKLTQVQTYIQSGNVVFRSASGASATLARKIGDLVENEHGFRPHLLLLSNHELDRTLAQNPFPDAVDEPKALHFFFLAEQPKKIDRAAFDKVKKANESYQLIDKVFYLRAPDGVGRSKLAATAEKLLGVKATARNYRTVEKLSSMAGNGS